MSFRKCAEFPAWVYGLFIRGTEEQTRETGKGVGVGDESARAETSSTPSALSPALPHTRALAYVRPPPPRRKKKNHPALKIAQTISTNLVERDPELCQRRAVWEGRVGDDVRLDLSYLATR